MQVGATNVLVLRLLGGLDVSCNGSPLSPSIRAKARALLGFLAVTGRAHTRQALCGLLWGELPDVDARTNLRVALANLNRELRAHLEITRGSIGLSLNASVWLDVNAFVNNLTRAHQPVQAPETDEMRAAVELYRGDFLEGFAVQDAPEFEEWMLAQRERLRQLYTEALVELIAQARQHGDQPAGIDYATRLLALEPWREAARRELMLMLAISGERGAALAQFETCRRVLWEELGVGPDEQTIGLYERIRSGEIAEIGRAADGSASHRVAERRQLTIASFGLREFRRLADQMDPEELEELLNRSQRRVAEAVSRHGGHLRAGFDAQWLAYFGYPVGYEDNAHRAVRAGLDCAQALASSALSDAYTPIDVGIHTGLVIVRRAQPNADPAVVGAVAATASELRAPGEHGAGAVTVSPETARLVNGVFDMRPLEGDPPAFRVTAMRQEDRVRHGQRPRTPLVGRERELQLLLDGWAQAQRRIGGVVLIRGEAGIGKSRLTWNLRDRVTANGGRVLVCHGAVQTSNTPFSAILELLNDGLMPTHRATLADLLGFAADSSSSDSPRARRLRAIGSVVDRLTDATRSRAVLLVIEDAQWLDPSSLEVLHLLCERITNLAMLAVVTCRPQFVPSWPKSLPITEIEPRALDRDQVTQIAEHIAGDCPLSQDALRHVLDHSDGIPLFAEELTRSALEVRGAEVGVLLPMTLRDAIVARLDLMATSKHVAQIAAAIGREFSPDVLAAVLPVERERLCAELAQLAEAGLLERQPADGSTNWAFKHALVQEVAYDSLPRRTRQDIHGAIGRALLDGFPEIVSSQPEVLATHFSRAGRVQQALVYWQLAARKALEQGANREAVSHFSQALQLLDQLPETPTRAAQELKLRVALAAPLRIVRGFTSPEVGETLDRARALCDQVGDPTDVFPIMRGLVTLYGMRGELNAASDVAQRMLRQAIRFNDPDLLLEAHAPLAWVAVHAGEFSAAREHLEKCIALYDPRRHRDLALLYGSDAGVYANATFGIVLWIQGHPDQALSSCTAAIKLARASGYAVNLAMSLHLAATLRYFRGELEDMQTLASEAVAVSEEHNMPHFRAMAALLVGAARAMRALPGTQANRSGVDQMEAATRAAQELGVADRSFGAALVGRVYARGREPELGLRHVERALQLALTDDRWCAAELHRVRGELLLCQSPVAEEEAEAAFWRAIDLARSQQAPALQLRASTSLARLRLRQDRASELEPLLLDCFSAIVGGEGTADIIEARDLLNRYGATGVSST